jgi:hypothetical protein
MRRADQNSFATDKIERVCEVVGAISWVEVYENDSDPEMRRSVREPGNNRET